MPDFNLQPDDMYPPGYQALCLQLAQCLRWYVAYLLDFNDEQGDNGFADEIKQCTELCESIEQHCLEKGPPTEYSRVIPWTGLVLHDGGKVGRPPWAK